MQISYQDIIQVANKYRITSKMQLAHLLGQCELESAGFTRLVESFNYSVEGLCKTWSTRFGQKIVDDKTKKTIIVPNDLAKSIGRTPTQPANQKQIALNVYNGREGNRTGTEDGWNYRGRGVKQLTHRNNYIAFNNWLKTQNIQKDVVANPDLVASDKELAILSAIWFWIMNKIGYLADQDNCTAVTIKINGGTIGIADRIKCTNKYKKILGINK